MKSNVTFIIFTKNEERRITYPIKCFLPYGDVIISDDFSTDKTRQIAKRLGAKVVNRYLSEAPFCETKEEADFVFSHIKTDWVFWGFADEMVPKACLEIYKKTSNENRYKAVVQKKKTLLYKTRHEYLPAYASIKFFKKNSIDFSNNKIHQMGKFNKHVKPSEILFLPPIDEYSIYHFSIHTTKQMLNVFQKYAKKQAEDTFYRNLSIHIFLKPVISFMIIYFLQGAFRNGVEGFIISVQYSYYTFLVYSFSFELHTKNTSETIEKEFKKTKELLLSRSSKSNIFKRVMGKFQISLISKLYIKKKLGKT